MQASLEDQPTLSEQTSEMLQMHKRQFLST